jgi:hypothetical protein
MEVIAELTAPTLLIASYFAYADSKAKMGPMYKHYEKGDARGGSQAQK